MGVCGTDAEGREGVCVCVRNTRTVTDECDAKLGAKSGAKSGAKIEANRGRHWRLGHKIVIQRYDCDRGWHRWMAQAMR